MHVFALKQLNDTDRIVLTFQGKETAKWMDKKSKEEVSLENTVILQDFTIYDYTEFYNVITPGEYSFPFTIYLPESLPQTNVCLHSADPENKPSGQNGKFGMITEARIEYTITASVRGLKHAIVENLQYQEHPLVENLQHQVPITVLIG